MIDEIEFRTTARRFLNRFGEILKDINTITEKLSKELTEEERTKVFFILQEEIDNSTALDPSQKQMFRLLFSQFVETEANSSFFG
jgi:hypothetical protein